MSNQLPKKLWRVVLKYGDGSRLSYGQIGSKTYGAESHARNHLAQLRNRGLECELYETEVLEWKLVEHSPQRVEGEQPLWDS